jgi:hypothetical protein
MQTINWTAATAVAEWSASTHRSQRMTDISAAQRAYDNAEPDSTYTMQFYATIGMGDAEVSCFAEVWEQSGEVHSVEEVSFHGINVADCLADEQYQSLMHQAQAEVNRRRNGGYYV